jgi:hypothetical protein
MWIIFIDFPLTYLGDKFNLPIFTALCLTILGTLLWLCIGVALSYIIPWFVRICMLRAQNEDEGT